MVMDAGCVSIPLLCLWRHGLLRYAPLILEAKQANAKLVQTTTQLPAAAWKWPFLKTLTNDHNARTKLIEKWILTWCTFVSLATTNLNRCLKSIVAIAKLSLTIKKCDSILLIRDDFTCDGQHKDVFESYALSKYRPDKNIRGPPICRTDWNLNE